MYFLTHHSRGMAAAELLIGESNAIVVTDDYSGYNRLDATRRQLCWCHLLRHLTAIGRTLRPRRAHRSVVGPVRALAVFRTRHRYRDGTISQTLYQRRMHRLRQSIECQFAAGARLKLDGRTKNQCLHLLRREPMFWTFLSDDRIPLQNNLAERAIRPAVIWRKTSHGTHSHRGDCFRPMILSVLQTARLHGVHGYAFLRRACGELFDHGEVTSRLPLPTAMPALPAPS